MGLKPEQYKTLLRASLLKNPKQAIFVTGAVGVGKSQVTKQVADELGFGFVDIRLSLLDATDLRGVPDIDKEKRETYWTKPVFLPPSDYKGDIVLFFDEFSNANSSIQNACLQLVLDRQLGEYKLPEGARVICAGNRLQDGAYVFRLSSALCNRFVNIEFQPDFDDWKGWAYANNINPLIIGFHNFRNGELLHNFKNDSDTRAFASPRSWFFVHNILNMGLENGVLYEAIKGAIGEGAGTEFYGYMKIYRDLPDVKDILVENKDIIPEESSVMYALCSALINYVRGDKTRLDRLITYSLKIQKEFSVVLVKDLLKTELKKEVVTSKAFDRWVEVNKDVIL